MSNTMGKRLLYTLGVSGLLLLGFVAGVQAAPPSQSPEEGEAVFEEYCTGCHTVGGGDLAGPDLAGVAETRDPAWLARWLDEPDVMLAEGDPIAAELLAKYNGIPMPNQDLSPVEIAALLAYMGAAEPVETPPAGDAPPPKLKGSAKNGKAIFTGSTRLAQGGTACIACHDTAQIGMLGGGMLGPDLTDAYDQYGANGLVAVLGSVPFPSMSPIYQDRPLTPQEQVDLTLFLEESAGKDAPSRIERHFVMYIFAFISMDVFLGLLFFWRRRTPKRRRRALTDR